MLVAGIDSSTQSTKVELRRLDDGTLAAEGRAPHPPVEPPRSEQNPEAWWAALAEALSRCGERLSEVAAVSVAAQQHGLVVLDAAGSPLRPAKLWNDTESAPQAAALVDRLGPEAWARACGSVPTASFTVTKLAWLMEREPGLADRIDALMLPHDYLTFRLTGARATDRGDASGTGWYDPAADCYRPDLLALAAGSGGLNGSDGSGEPAKLGGLSEPSGSVEAGGLSEPGGSDRWTRCLPRVLGPTEAAGEVTAEAAAATGLPAGIPVAAGTGDNMAAALGLGLRPGDLALSLGTSGTAYAVSEDPACDPTGHVAGFCDATGRHLPLVCTLNATRVTDAVAAWLGLDPAGLAAAALESPPGAAGTVLVPYFDGERTPNRPDATGTLYGLRTATTRADLARAAHEGVVCGLLAGVDALRAAGAAAEGRWHLVGGGARSPAYRRVAADLAQKPIRVPAAAEIVAAGACVQAAAQVGLPLGDAPEAWALGAGADTNPDPAVDAPAIRAAYAQAASAAATVSWRPSPSSRARKASPPVRHT